MTDTSWVPGEHIQSAHAAEQMAAHAMRTMGFADALETPVGPDGGVDVRATGAIGQVKWRSAQTGRQEIQALVGARGRNHDFTLFFFSASGFSAQAIEYGSTMDVALFTYDVRGSVTPASPAAEIASRPRLSTTPDPASVTSAPQPGPRYVRSAKAPKVPWLGMLVGLCSFGTVASLIGVFTSPDATWGQVFLFFVAAVVGAIALRSRASARRQP